MNQDNIPDNLPSDPGIRRLVESGRIFRAIFDQAALGIVYTTAEGRYIRVNRSFCEITGYTADELLGMDFRQTTHPDDLGADLDRLGRMRRGEIDSYSVEKRYLRKDGETIWVRLSASPIRDENGAVLFAVGVVEEVTERRRVEADLRAARDLLGDIIEFLPDAAFVIDRDRRVIAWNRAIEEMTGVPKDEMLGKGDYAYAVPFYGKRRPVVIDLIAESDQEDEALYDYVDRRGDRIYAETYVQSLFGGRGAHIWVNASPLLDADGEVVGAIETVRDITARVETERRLRESEERFRTLIETMQEGFHVINTKDVVTYANASLATMLGRSRGELIGRKVLEFVDERDRALVEAKLDRRRSDIAERYEVRLRRKDGGVIWALVSPARLFDGDGGYAGSFGIVTDITGLRRRDEALVESERRLSTLIGNLPGIAYRCLNAPDWPMEYIGGALVELTGYDTAELVDEGGIGYGDLIHPDDRPMVWETVQESVAADRPFQMEYRIETKSGETKWVWEQGRAIRGAGGETIALEGFITDITDRISLEAQLRHSVKMEAIGRLAGGVAHDFNNLLTAILGYGDMVAEQLGPGDPNREDIDEIRRAAERAAALTSQLLAFSRRQIIQPAVIDVNGVVVDLDRMLRRMIGENVRLETDLAPSLAHVRADRGQIEQVVMNLVVNARDAIAAGGRIALRTGNVDLGEEYARAHAGVAPGRYVLLAVEDDGVGMDADTISRIFEPFFTTKPEWGTGLGLSTVYGIVTQGGGSIDVESSPGKGAEFRVYLPAVDEPVDEPAAPRALPPETGTEAVLVIEDEDAVRALVARILAGHGYRVTVAADPAEALAACEAARFDLAVSDLVLPGMGGRELADALRLRGGPARVLFMSGYTEDAVVSREVHDADIPFIRKPFTVEALLRKVRETIDGA
ncbi:MAG: PAS domain S-box protein [Candidatus Krumholzibacteriota bacterium]|nr:PAS domain S-box protein [Candidatus Krumholzibacteriota bacterium]